MTALALCVGLNAVAPARYEGWNGVLAGCENDARAMAALATAAGYRPTVLVTEEATAANVLQEIARAARLLGPGDTFLLTLACHGTQLPSDDPGETDGLDEAVVLFDRMVRDDEIDAALRAFDRGVRLLMVGDLCHSGTVSRVGPGEVVASPRSMPPGLAALVAERHPTPSRSRAVPLPPSDVLLLSACRDGETTGDGPGNGVFTAALLQTWADGAFVGDYRGFRKRIGDLLPDTQNPGLLALTAAAERRQDEHPFSTIPLENTEKTMTVTALPVPTDDTTTGPRPAPAGMPAELAARLDLATVVDPLAAATTPAALQTVSELSGARPLVFGARGSGITTETSWWGLTMKVPHTELQNVLDSVDMVNTLVGLIGGSIPSVAQPYIILIAEFVEKNSTHIRAQDKGFGVYLSMSWFAPGVIVSKSVEAGDRSRDGGPLHSVDVEVGRLAGEVDSGLVVEHGQRIVVSATGTVWSGIIFTGPNGPGGWMDWEAGVDAPLPGQRPFGLLARIDGKTSYVGTGRSWIHEGAAARLFFLVNDHRRIGNGAFQVHVDVYAS
jgi:metacaspase-1